MTFADLHTHSTASDGTYTPAQILQHASDLEDIEILAVTDHDTLEGSRAALAALDSSHTGMVQLVPGVEIASSHMGRSIHMLGYFIDVNNAPLMQFLDENVSKRRQRALDMADRLWQAGFPVSSQDLLSLNQSVNRPLLARLLVERGCAQSVDDAFKRLIGPISPYYIDVEYPSAVEVIRLIGEAGGYAFIAHPARYRVIDLIGELGHEGMRGLEAYHSMQTQQQSEELVSLAAELGLGVSGGSDWHGDTLHCAALGSAGLDEDGYHAFLRACERA